MLESPTGRRAAGPAGQLPLSAALGLFTLACGSGLAKVPSGPHRTSLMSPVPVDFAPPPAQIEYVEAPAKGASSSCAWLDGAWQWTGRDWRWVPGGWVVAPPDCYYAPPVLVWVAAGGDGALYHVPGRWYGNDAAPACPDPAPCSASQAPSKP